jgi:hypothetical protein
VRGQGVFTVKKMKQSKLLNVFAQESGRILTFWETTLNKDHRSQNCGLPVTPYQQKRHQPPQSGGL